LVVYGASVLIAMRKTPRQSDCAEYSQRRTLGLSFHRHRRDFSSADGRDQRSHRIEAHGDYLLGLIRRQPDITLLEIQGRLIANCGEHFSSSVIWRFFARHEDSVKVIARYGAPGLVASISVAARFRHFFFDACDRWRTATAAIGLSDTEGAFTLSKKKA
jgi:hypothetical protein